MPQKFDSNSVPLSPLTLMGRKRRTRFTYLPFSMQSPYTRCGVGASIRPCISGTKQKFWSDIFICDRQAKQRRDYGLCSKIHSYFIFELRRLFLFASFLVLGAFRSPVGRSYRLATFCELVLRELALRTHLTKCTQAIFNHTPPLRKIASSIFVRGRSFASPSPNPPWIVKTSFILFAPHYDHSLPLPGAGNTTEARRPAVSLSMSTQMGSRRKFVFRPNLWQKIASDVLAPLRGFPLQKLLRPLAPLRFF